MRRPISQTKLKTDARSRLRRWGARLLFWGLLVACGGVLVMGGGVLLSRILLSANPHFVLRHVALEGQHTLNEDQVRERLAQAGAVVGTSNLMRLPMRRLRETLEQDPVVDHAELLRRLPDRLEVRVVERTPVAAVRSAMPCLLDAEGMVLPWRDHSKERLLPVITAVRQAAQLTPGERVTDDALLGAVRLLRLLARRADGPAYDIELIQIDYQLPSLRLHLRPRGTFTAGAVLVVPVVGMEEALDRLRDIHRLRTAAGSTTSFVDVTYRRNVPVRP